MSTQRPPAPVEIFFSYAHEDETLKEELRSHLALLQRVGMIVKWHDRMISAGSEWASEIDARLNSAKIILLLISADFMDSDYCFGVETQRALERHAAGDARVIPIILRPCIWRVGPFSHLQALPTDGRPVTSWPNRDDAYTNIGEGIQRVVAELNANPR